VDESVLSLQQALPALRAPPAHHPTSWMT